MSDTRLQGALAMFGVCSVARQPVEPVTRMSVLSAAGHHEVVDGIGFDEGKVVVQVTEI